jgi:protein phosphatase 2C family protein 2/3
LKEQHEYQQGNYGQAMVDSYLSLDDELYVVYDPMAHHGCTAVTALISDDAVYVANAGDSRAVLSVNGSAKPLSFDHKPTHHGEYHRIINAGGFVERGRVNGKLALSRAIGDFEFKDQPRVTSKAPQLFAVTANPEIIIRRLTSEDEFLVLACDGIWDCATSQKVVGFIRRSIAEGQELDFICENFMNYCLADVNNMLGIGTDNMTIMIIGFLNGRTKKEWYELIRTRVLNDEGPAATVEEVKPKLVEKEDTLIDENDRLNLVDEIKTQPTSISLQQLLGIDASIKNENGIMVIHNRLAATLTQLANPASESSPTSAKDEE